MQIYLIEDVKDDEEHKSFIKEIVEICSQEFFPPLTARFTTTDVKLNKNVVANGRIDDYIDFLYKQINLFVTIESKLVGYMSFIHNFHNDAVFGDLRGINNYITTICVLPEYRGRGIAKALYDFIETKLPQELTSNIISTRTWCKNKDHIQVLKKRGYLLTCTNNDDREYNGEISSTVYYAKKIKISQPKCERSLFMNEKKKKKMLIITTGGTIAQDKVDGITNISEDHNDLFFKEKLRDATEKLGIEVNTKDAFNIDSSNVCPYHWVELINLIIENYNEFDAFLVIHGTNTMAYTASALSFALGKIDKPVILTGAQIPLSEVGTDGLSNLERATMVAADDRIKGVMVVFGTQIIAGTRAKKTTVSGIEAFKSFNSYPIGTIGVGVDINEDQLKKYLGEAEKIVPAEKFAVEKFPVSKILSLTEFPGLCPDLLISIAKTGTVKGFIIRSSGAGDANILPKEEKVEDEQTSLRNFFEYLQENKIPIVVTTHAPDGVASMDVNKPGQLAKELGAIPAWDMSMESITVKLSWLLGQELSYERIYDKMLNPIHDEIRPKAK